MNTARRKLAAVAAGAAIALGLVPVSYADPAICSTGKNGALCNPSGNSGQQDGGTPCPAADQPGPTARTAPAGMKLR